MNSTALHHVVLRSLQLAGSLIGTISPARLARESPDPDDVAPSAPDYVRRMEATPPADPQVLLRSRSYVKLLVLAAVLGVPVSAASYGFLALVDWLQDAVFTDLPKTLGFDSAPVWWPLPLLALSGLLAALAIRYLPGTGGHSPPTASKAAGPLPPAQLPACCSPPSPRSRSAPCSVPRRR
jgi:hypothetical protein